MADGKITIYGELESGVPNGKIVNYSLVANTPDVYTKEEIDEKFENTSGGGGGGTPSVDLSDYAKKEYVDDEVQKAKDYTDTQIGNIDIPELPTLANVATSGSYNDLKDTPDIPSVEGLATTTEVANALASANTYTDEKFNSIDIPELPDLAKVAETGDYNDLSNLPDIPDVSNLETKDVVAQNLAEAKQYTDDKMAVLATKEEVGTAFTEFEGVVEQGFNTKQDKTAIVTATNSVSVDKRSEINVTGDVVISLEPYEQDGYAYSYEIVLHIGDTAYSVTFPSNIKWVKDLEIVPNARYYIIIEDNTAMWMAVTN